MSPRHTSSSRALVVARLGLAASLLTLLASLAFAGLQRASGASVKPSSPL